MEYTLKQRQRGFLLIFALVLILVMSFISLMLTHLFTDQTNTSSNQLSSKQALSIAVSGLDIAKRDLTKKAIACNALGTLHTAEPLLNGEFSIVGAQTNVITVLSENLTTTSSSIHLADATGLAASGIVKIDNEYIYYASLSGNVLSTLTRGKASSSPSSHNSGVTVIHSQCMITSTGAIPTFNAAKYKNSVSSVVVMSGEMSFGGYQPSVSSAGDVSLSGSAYIANPGIAVNDPDYVGSTVGIMSSYSLDLSGNASTMNEDSTGTGLVSSSTKQNILSDVIQNVSTDPSLYFSYFGTYTPAQLQATATAQGNYYNTSLSNTTIDAINGVMGEVIYVNGDINLSSNTSLTIGSPTAPVVLYVDGSFTSTGTLNLTIYGIIYVTGAINFSGDAAIDGQGSLATESGLNMTGSTHIALTLESDDPVLATLYSSIVPGAGTTVYTTQDLGIQQIYP